MDHLKHPPSHGPCATVCKSCATPTFTWPMCKLCAIHVQHPPSHGPCANCVQFMCNTHLHMAQVQFMCNTHLHICQVQLCANHVQNQTSHGPGATVCKSYAAHPPLIMCNITNIDADSFLVSKTVNHGTLLAGLFNIPATC